MKHSEEAIFVALSKGDKQTAQRLIDRMAPEERKSFYAIAIDAASMVPTPEDREQEKLGQDPREVGLALTSKLDAATKLPFGATVAVGASVNANPETW